MEKKSVFKSQELQIDGTIRKFLIVQRHHGHDMPWDLPKDI